MSLKKLFAEECLQVGTKAGNKAAVITELSRLAKKSPLLDSIPEAEIIAKLTGREELSTTAFADGVAIPHCFFDSLKDFVIGLLVVPGGVDFESMDNKPTQLLFFIIAPSSQRNKHIKILSSISRMVKNPGIIHALCTVNSSRELNTIVNRSIQYREESQFKTDFCELTIFLQREEFFDDILEILSGNTDGALTVIESNNAAYFLHRIPLFSSFWHDTENKFSRLILCVVKKQLLNNILREIYSIKENLNEESGLLITASDLIYASGHIDY